MMEADAVGDKHLCAHAPMMAEQAFVRSQPLNSLSRCTCSVYIPESKEQRIAEGASDSASLVVFDRSNPDQLVGAVDLLMV